MRLASLIPSTVLVTLLVASSIFAAPYQIDLSHSNVGFSVRHMFTNTQGNFKSFGGSFDFDSSSTKLSNVNISIDPKSINTNNEKRDGHLIGPDFFDVAQFPTIKFTSTKIVDNKKNAYTIYGDLTLHGVTKPAIFVASFLGAAKNPWGQDVVSFTATTQINRKHFGIIWNKALDKGQALLGETVTITVDIEANPTPATSK